MYVRQTGSGKRVRELCGGGSSTDAKRIAFTGQILAKSGSKNAVIRLSGVQLFTVDAEVHVATSFY